MRNNQPISADEPLLRRIRGEYLEMPGLRLTSAQAQRLWGLDAQTCSAVLDDLVGSKFLARSNDGKYMRLAEGGLPPLRMARVDREPERGKARGENRLPRRETA
jgi:hypothetical protein